MEARKIKLVVVGVLVAGSLGALVAVSLMGNMVYAVSVAEYHQGKDRYHDRGMRVEGVLTSDTHRVSTTAAGARHTFTIHDKERSDLSLDVLFVGPVPDTMRETGDMMIEGKMGPDGVFVATKVTPKCASKYDQTIEDAYPSHEGYDAAGAAKSSL